MQSLRPPVKGLPDLIETQITVYLLPPPLILKFTFGWFTKIFVDHFHIYLIRLLVRQKKCYRLFTSIPYLS